MRAVLPVAGAGTRFLPITKALPKEMLPIVDRPCVAYAVAEAVEAGIGDVVLVTSRGKSAIEDYFDASPELEARLDAVGKRALAHEVRAAARLARVVSVRQAEPLGLGHAILQAASVVGDASFAVLLPDHLIPGETPAIGQLLAAQRDPSEAMVGLYEVEPEETARYGVASGPEVGDRLRIDMIVEKPGPARAPSRLAVVGRYLLPNDIFAILASTPPGWGGEVQLTDALSVLAGAGRAFGLPLHGDHFDTGHPVGLFSASIHYMLRHPTYGAEAAAALRRFA